MASQFDSFEIAYDTDNYGPGTPQQYTFVDKFQLGTITLLETVPPDTAVYSSTCLTHCLTEQATFFSFEVNNVTVMKALTEWFVDGEAVRVVSGCLVSEEASLCMRLPLTDMKCRWWFP